MTAAVGLACAALLACAGTASADSGRVGIATDSPGFLSGNVVQTPSTSMPTSAATRST